MVFRGLTPTSSLLKPSARVVTRVNLNHQPSLKCKWDSSSSNECSPRVGVPVRVTLLAVTRQ